MTIGSNKEHCNLQRSLPYMVGLSHKDSRKQTIESFHLEPWREVEMWTATHNLKEHN